MKEFYVLDLGRCDISEWHSQHLEWEGADAESVARDACEFWCLDEMNDHDLEEMAAHVVVASDPSGTDAREFVVDVTRQVRIRVTVDDDGPIDIPRIDKIIG